MRSRIGAHQPLLDKISYISTIIRTLPTGTESDYMTAELCKYCCILAAAALDLCLEDCLIEYAEQKSEERLVAFVRRQLSRARNPTIGMMLAVLDSFDARWKEQLDLFADQKIRSDIGSIVSNRNEIAHGRNSQISFGRLMPWVKSARELCAHLERIVFP